MIYNTKQRKLILEIFKENKNSLLNAKEIKSLLNDKVSKATLYRLLNILCEENIIKKSFNEFNNSYEYSLNENNDCNNHLHLKCDLCGKIIHLKEIKPELNNFLIDFSHSIIHGTCKACLNRS